MGRLPTLPSKGDRFALFALDDMDKERRPAIVILFRSNPSSTRTVCEDIRKPTILIAVAMCGLTSALAQDYLTPEPGPLADEREYHTKVREVFAELCRDNVVQVVFFPSFKPEEIAGIRKIESGFEAFVSKPSSQIWQTYMIYEEEKGNHGNAPRDPNSALPEMKRQFPSDFREITVHTDSRPISAPLTERIRRVWQDMLLGARHSKRPLVNDGETYHFSMWVYEHGMVSGEAWSPERGKTLALTRLAEALTDYARGKADEKKITQLVKLLER